MGIFFFFFHLVRVFDNNKSSLFLLLHRNQISHHIHHSGSLLMWIIFILFNHKSWDCFTFNVNSIYMRKEELASSKIWNCIFGNLCNIDDPLPIWPHWLSSQEKLNLIIVLHPFLSSFPSAILFVYYLIIIIDIICLKVDWFLPMKHFHSEFLTLFFVAPFCFSSQFSSHFIFYGH